MQQRRHDDDVSFSDFNWWERGIIYQIYPRSFMDSNGDGIGDLAGIRQKLDYLQWLGVDAIWISPIYPSPMADFGYDVSHYTDIDPIFGTLAEFDALLADVHARGMKLLLDYVPNHTSDQHPWFIESRSSRASAKRDWYIWRDPLGGEPPNNWRANFGGSAWQWDEKTSQYYYHAFLKEQPDLNWRNPEVQRAMLEVLRFWLDRGVDGFRVDVMHHLVKDTEFRDNPPNPDWQPDMSPYRELLTTYTADLPEVQEIVALMRGVIDEYEDRMLVGEIYLPVERLMAYYGASGRGAHLPFNFQLIRLPWKAKDVARTVERYEALLPSYAWPNWVLGNHDKPRIATRAGMPQARVAAMLLLTLRGTPTMYYGDELGMHDVPIPPEHVRDPFEKNVPGLGLGRDPVRTPMQWTADENAGFSTAEPWLPVAADYKDLNVAMERAHASSLLTLYRRLIELRRSETALSVGSYAALPAGDDLMAYMRKTGERRLLIVLNFGGQPRGFDLADLQAQPSLLLSTHLDREPQELGDEIFLRGNEGVVIELR
ncbi:MAG TPA: alpha-amylase family glycosyl hydrolase [Candidatus Limnocylindria bacterium]|nr:alpha-amylase family glycosyl hydrolase [Candidatus Limnocylindria bacterium]